MREFTSLLLHHSEAICELTESQVTELERHYERLRRWNKKVNLTSLTRLEDIVVRHYCESLVLATKLPADAASVADIGSGAGFPGTPMAVLRSDCSFSLVESNSRKCVFLRESTRHLRNVRILEQRAETLTGRFDWVVSRAVRWNNLVQKLAELGDNIGLLTGVSKAGEIRHVKSIDWSEPLRLPWGERRVILLGRVSRET